MIDDNYQPSIIQKFQGRPNEISKNEIPTWKRYLAYIFPWLNNKWLLGERFVNAQVEKIEAETVKIKAEGINYLAEATLKLEQARDIVRQASIKEQQMLKEMQGRPISVDDTNSKLDEIEAQIRYLSAVCGTTVHIHIKGHDNIQSSQQEP